MSPRRNHRRDDQAPLEVGLARRGVQSVQEHAGAEWIVRNIPGGAATKTYRCPGCDHEIRPGVAHVVAWPTQEWGDLNDRRHWHTGCWRARDRRRTGG